MCVCVPMVREVLQVVRDEHRVHLPEILADPLDRQRQRGRSLCQVAFYARPAEGEAPVQLVLIIGRHHRQHAQLASDLGAALRDGGAEGLCLVPVVVVPHPDLVLSRPRHSERAVALRFRVVGRHPHRVPLALATGAHLRADARACDAPEARVVARGVARAGATRPVAEIPRDSLEPLRLEPQVQWQRGRRRHVLLGGGEVRATCKQHHGESGS